MSKRIEAERPKSMSERLRELREAQQRDAHTDAGDYAAAPARGSEWDGWDGQTDLFPEATHEA